MNSEVTKKINRIHEKLSKSVPPNPPSYKPVDTPWSFTAADADAIEKRGGFSLLKKCHAIYIDSMGEKRAALKLPHHKIEGGRMTVNKRGCIAAKAAIMGARGGVKAPASDKSRALSHINSHLRNDFDMYVTAKAEKLEELSKAILQDELNKIGTENE